MDNRPQNVRMSDTGEDQFPISELPSTPHFNGLPTLLTATSPKFPATFANVASSIPPSQMADEFTSGKGKGKRPAEAMEIDDELERAVEYAPHSEAPTTLRRQRHRRRNVAATIWGHQLPMQAQSASQPFNIYKAIIRHPNLFFQFTIRLPYLAIINLYAIDKEFHYRFNKYSTSIIHDYTSYHAPQAAYIFSWILFPQLCISDPMLRPMDNRPHLARDIPSLRWAKMVLYRNTVTRGILTNLGLEGLRVPHGTHVALMKFWLLMETKTMAMRTAFLSNSEVWTDMDIVCFWHFLVKLDMRISDPVSGHGMCELSHMLLTQKSLTMLFQVLTGKKVMDYDEATDIVVRTYLTDDLDADNHTWIDDELENGVPEEHWGLLCRENWDTEGDQLEPAVDMVLTEGLKRGLNPQKMFLDFMIYGFVDEGIGTNVPAPRKWRGERNIEVPGEAWPVGKVRKRVVEELDARFNINKVEENRIVRLVVPNPPGVLGLNLWIEAVDLM